MVEAGPEQLDSHPDEEGRRAWTAYLSAADNRQTVDACIDNSRPRFAPLRRVLGRLVDRIEPETSICLGAGALNDLPFRALVRHSRQIHLIDWIGGMADQGIAHSVISQDLPERPECVFCGLEEAGARDYCEEYSGPAFDGAGVCSSYRASDDNLSCANYRRGCRPHVHESDVTAGYAEEFGLRILSQINAAKNRRDAYAKATKLATKLAKRRDTKRARRITIADGVADLVVSSMVISQFEWEPYGFFSRLVDRRFGLVEKPDMTKALRRSGILRDILFRNTLDRHLAEIRRMLKPGGVGFLAFEMYHREAADRPWFPVGQMHEAIPRIDKMFDFDFDVLPASDHVVEIFDGAARSLIYSFALHPKISDGKSA